MSVGGIFLVNGRQRKVQPPVGGAAPGQVVLGCARKRAEQAREASLPRSPISASVSAFTFFDDGL